MDPRFHGVLHRLPEGNWSDEAIWLEGVPVKRLLVTPESLVLPLGITFDTAFQQLSQLPRLFIEADGSFVWTSAAEENPRWQVDGQLHDGRQFLQSVEFHGQCPAAVFQQLVMVVGHTPHELAVQLIRQGLFVRANEFLRLLAAH